MECRITTSCPYCVVCGGLLLAGIHLNNHTTEHEGQRPHGQEVGRGTRTCMDGNGQRQTPHFQSTGDGPKTSHHHTTREGMCPPLMTYNTKIVESAVYCQALVVGVVEVGRLRWRCPTSRPNASPET